MVREYSLATPMSMSMKYWLSLTLFFRHVAKGSTLFLLNSIIQLRQHNKSDQKDKFYLLKSAANFAMASITSFPSSCPLPCNPCFFPGAALAISSSPITLYEPIWNWLATNDGPFSFHVQFESKGWFFPLTPHSQFGH